MIRSLNEFPGYSITDAGEIISNWLSMAGRPRKLRVGNSGYLQCNLRDIDKKIRGIMVHRYVAKVFLGEPPTPKHWVAHYDGNRLNNHVSNLRWATPAENQSDKKRHGTYLTGEQVGTAKISDPQVSEIRGRYAAGGISQRLLGAEYGIGQAQVCRIVRGHQRGGIHG